MVDLILPTPKDDVTKVIGQELGKVESCLKVFRQNVCRKKKKTYQFHLSLVLVTLSPPLENSWLSKTTLTA